MRRGLISEFISPNRNETKTCPWNGSHEHILPQHRARAHAAHTDGTVSKNCVISTEFNFQCATKCTVNNYHQITDLIIAPLMRMDRTFLVASIAQQPSSFIERRTEYIQCTTKQIRTIALFQRKFKETFCEIDIHQLGLSHGTLWECNEYGLLTDNIHWIWTQTNWLRHPSWLRFTS